MATWSGIRTRTLALQASLAALALVLARHRYVGPAELPGEDAAIYTMRGIRYADHIVGIDPLGALSFASSPALHPPLHPFLMGSWMSIWGTTLDAARSYGAAGLAVCLVLALPWLGRRLDPERGAIVGGMVGAVCLFSMVHMALAFSAMTESSALLTTTLALGWLSGRDGRFRTALLGGLGILAASLVRYNMVPMLLAPLIAWRVVEWIRGTRTRPLELVAWATPTLLLYGAWILAVPGELDAIRVFMVNVRDREHTLAETLLWVPTTLFDHSLGWILGPLVVVAFLAGLAPAILGRSLSRTLGPLQLQLDTLPGLRLVQLFVLATWAALTLHPYKLVRNVHVLVPMLLLTAALPLARSRLAAPRRVVLGLGVLLLGLFASHQALVGSSRTMPNKQYDTLPLTQDIVDAIDHAAKDSSHLVVMGTKRPFSISLPELIARDRHRAYTVEFGWAPGTLKPGMRTYGLLAEGQDGDVTEYLQPDLAQQTTFVLIEDTNSSGGGSQLLADNLVTGAGYLQQLGRVSSETVDINQFDMRLHIYAPSQSSGARPPSRPQAPQPRHPMGGQRR